MIHRASLRRFLLALSLGALGLGRPLTARAQEETAARSAPGEGGRERVDAGEPRRGFRKPFDDARDPERAERATELFRRRLERRRALAQPTAERRELALLPLWQAASGDAALLDHLKGVLDEAPRTITNLPDERLDRRAVAERRAWVPIFAQPELRKIAVAQLASRINRWSDDLKAFVKGHPERAVWDVAFIGAGPNTATAAQALREASRDQPRRMVVLDAGSEIAQTFRRAGNTVERNSTSRVEDGKSALRQGAGNKNPWLGPVGDPDLAGGEFPGLDGFADVATANLFASGTDFLMSSRFLGYREAGQGAPARYELRFETTAPRGGRQSGAGERYTIFADAIVLGTGLGAPSLPRGLPAAAERLIQRERAQVDLDRPGRVPRITHFAEAIALANLGTRDPYRAAVLPRTETHVLGKRLTGSGLRLVLEQPRELRASASDPLPTREVDLASVAELRRNGPTGGFNLALARGERFTVEAGKLAVVDASGRRVALDAAGIDDLDQLAGRIRLGQIGEGADAITLPRGVRERFAVSEVEVATPRELRLELFRQLTRGGRLRGSATPLADDFAIRNDAKELASTADLDGKLYDVYADAAGWTVEYVDGRVERFAELYTQLEDGRVRRTNPEFQPFQLFAEEAARKRPRPPKIAVIGGGDSGKTFLQWLYGQGSETKYTGNGKRDTAARGAVGDVTWVVGSRGPADCDRFLSKTRSRYLQLVGKTRGDTPQARLTNLDLADVSEITDGADRGRLLMTLREAGGALRQQVVDRIVIATGYANVAPRLLGVAPEALQPVTGRLPQLTGERVLGKQVAGQDVYVIGPAAGDDQVGPDERFSTSENVAALYAFRDRIKSLVERRLGQGDGNPRALASDRLYDRPFPLVRSGNGREQRAELRERDAGELRFQPRIQAKEVAIRAELLDLLTPLVPPAGLRSIQLVVEKRKGRLSLGSSDLDPTSFHLLRTAIERRALLVRELRAAADGVDAVILKLPIETLANGARPRSVFGGGIEILRSTGERERARRRAVRP